MPRSSGTRPSESSSPSGRLEEPGLLGPGAGVVPPCPGLPHTRINVEAVQPLQPREPGRQCALVGRRGVIRCGVVPAVTSGEERKLLIKVGEKPAPGSRAETQRVA